MTPSTVSTLASFDFRRLKRVAGFFPTSSLTECVPSLAAGASEVAAMALESSLGGLDVFEDEYLRWCVRAEKWRDEAATETCGEREEIVDSIGFKELPRAALLKEEESMAGPQAASAERCGRR